MHPLRWISTLTVLLALDGCDLPPFEDTEGDPGSSSTIGGTTVSHESTTTIGSSTTTSSTTDEGGSSESDSGSETTGAMVPACDPAPPDMCADMDPPTENCQGACDYLAEWTRLLGCEASSALDMAIDSAGDLVIVGTIGNDIMVRKYDGSGLLVWSHRIVEPMMVDPRSVAVGPDDSIVIEGEFDGGATLHDLWIRKLDPDGCELWTQIYDTTAWGSTYVDRAGPVAVDDAGIIYVTGTHRCQNCILTHGTVVAYAPDGTQQWADDILNGPIGELRPYDAVRHPDGGVLLVGSEAGMPSYSVVYHLAADDTLQWSNSFSVPPWWYSINVALGIALGDNEIIVGGRAGQEYSGPRGYVQYNTLGGALIDRVFHLDLPLVNRGARMVAPGVGGSIWQAGGGIGYINASSDPLIWLRHTGAGGALLSEWTLELPVDQRVMAMATDGDAVYLLATRGQGLSQRAWLRRYQPGL